MTRNEKRDLAGFLKLLLAAVIITAALAWGGHSDFVDATVCEMQNNGAYLRLSAANPEATDAELAKIYLHERGER